MRMKKTGLTVSAQKEGKTQGVCFDRQETNIVKGVLIIMMLLHHLFYDLATFDGYTVSFAPFSAHQAVVLVQSFKYAMAAFAFVTYYGMAAKMKAAGKGRGEKMGLKMAFKRYVTLILSFLPVYALSVLLALVMKRGLASVYTSNDQSFFGYALIDAAGLADFFGTPSLNITWWYLSFAFIIIFLFPFFYSLYERFGALYVIGALVLPVAMGWNTTYLGICSFTLALGIYIQDKSVFERLRGLGGGSAVSVLFKLIVGILYFVLLCRLPYVVPASNFNFAAGTFWVCLFSFEFLSRIPGIRQALGLLGKHSMNIFLIHTFIYYYYFKDFTYSFGYWLIIAAVLMGISLAVSILIEAAKRAAGYPHVIAKVMEKLHLA